MAATRDGISATAEVVKGGNKIVEIRVPVQGYMANKALWTGEAVVTMQIPAGSAYPFVVVDNERPIKVREVPRGD